MKPLPKIVLDTNILVSALRSSAGPSFALVQCIRAKNVRMYCSPALFLEYEEVLKRAEQLKASGLLLADIDVILADLASYIVPVITHYRWRPQLRDPCDEMVLEAAANAGAQAIVTYNIREFVPAARFGIEVFKPAQCFHHFQLDKSVRKDPSP